MKVTVEDQPNIMHIPKSSMCECCVRHVSACADMDFDLMPVLERGQNIIVVRCTEWKKRK